MGTAVGTNLATDGWNASAHAVHNFIKQPGQPHAPLTPLAVTMAVSYSDSAAIALAASVITGPGYAALVAGPSPESGSDAGWTDFLARYPGAPVGWLHVDLVLTGQVDKVVRVTNIQIERIGLPSAPLSGTYIPIPHQGASAAYVFSANMNAPNPVLRRVPSGQTFPDFNITVSKEDQETIAINFLAARYSSRWILHFTYQVGTKVHYLDVREPNKQPFAVTAAARSYGATYVSDYPTGIGYYLKR